MEPNDVSLDVGFPMVETTLPWAISGCEKSEGESQFPISDMVPIPAMPLCIYELSSEHGPPISLCTFHVLLVDRAGEDKWWG